MAKLIVSSDGLSFLDDEEKMRDFYLLSKEEFLASYSYLTEEEYEATKRDLEEIRKYDYLMSLKQDVLVSLYLQTKKERDMAISQLKEHGYAFKRMEENNNAD